MKRNNKKGFTIVELVIVIAVIAILSAVLIPTFGGIVEKANDSAADQAARNGYAECYALDMADGVLDGKEGTETINDTNYKVTLASGETPASAIYYAVNKNGGYATFNGSVFGDADSIQ